MFTRSEVKTLKASFWTAYGRYMKLQPQYGWEDKNWINYKTGIRYLHFSTDADQHHAYVAITYRHPDAEIRELFMEEWFKLQQHFLNHFDTEWEWFVHYDENLAEKSA